METVTPDHDSFYLSAPTSPSTPSMDGLCFYSVPTSPTTNPLKSFYDAETEPTTPHPYEDANSGFIDFEFEISRSFNLADYDHDFEKSPTFEMPCVQRKQQEKEHCKGSSSLPAMAFADELFCNGKVVPLKPPPRLQYGNTVENSSTLSSPRSPSGRLKFPFQRRSLWNDDFDPFMVALETVKQEQRERTHRRARSMSPLRARSPERHANSSIRVKNHQDIIKEPRPNLDGQMELNDSGPCSIWVPNQNGDMCLQEQRKPIRLAEPKGVLFARRARLVKVGHEDLGEPSLRNGPAQGETQEGPKEGEGASTRGSKRQKIKKFLLKSASIGRKSNEEKQKDESETLPKRSYTRKFSFKSKKLVQYNEEKRVSEVSKMTIMQYRPKLFLCMSYGTRLRVYNRNKDGHMVKQLP